MEGSPGAGPSSHADGLRGRPDHDDRDGGDDVAGRIRGWLAAIGLPVRDAPVPPGTALPGITIREGGLVADPDGRWYPGDLLHEAGHLAVLTPSARRATDGNLDREVGQATELAAICWSWAACTDVGLDPAVVFHADGYRGDSDWLIDTFSGGAYPGLPVLVWAGLTWTPGQAPDGEPAFPGMRRWLRVDGSPGPSGPGERDEPVTRT